MKTYHDVLKKEINAQYDAIGPIELKSIYFGGGTPSTYPNDLLLDMFDTLNKVSRFDKQTEITLEINPGTVTREKVEHWKQLGVNRLSIGVQSLNEKVLKNVNRLQTNDDVLKALNYAEGLFENMSIDLIIGLPQVSPDEWKKQLHSIMAWPIKHIAIYFLTVHEFTPLYYRVQKQDIVLPDDDSLVALYLWTVSFLAEHGFNQYEVSNFAQQGFESKHNKAYWQRKPYRGFGVGAWSFDGASRFRNRKNLSLYMKGVESGDRVECSEILDQEQVVLETIMLSLRQQNGLRLDQYQQMLSTATYTQKQEALMQLQDAGLIKEEDGHLRLTVQGFAVEQRVIAALSP